MLGLLWAEISKAFASKKKKLIIMGRGGKNPEEKKTKEPKHRGGW